MTIQMFTIRDHVFKIKNGTKCQTTRKGFKKIKDGQKIQQYYKPRMKKGMCINCIQDFSVCHPEHREEIGYIGCYIWTNYFGEVPVTDVVYYPSGLVSMSPDDFNKWAVDEGFNSPSEAISWFEMQYGDGWDTMPVSVIKWDHNKRRFK